jgi:peptidoglycan hydrolase-like protein with peptidoglycan-binding domain
MVAAVATVAVVGTNGSSVHPAARPAPAHRTHHPTGPVALSVLATSPADGATVPSDAPVMVDLSAPLAPGSPLPELTPAVPGTWAALSPTRLIFDAAGPLTPGAHETLNVPAGSGGLVGSRGQRLAGPVTASFTVAPGSVLRAQQLLAELGYLPVTFTPLAAPTSPQQLADPQPGSFSWRWSDLPSRLTSLWTPGSVDTVTRGAVMAFEDQHGLSTDGQIGPEVWTALLQAAAAGSADPDPYDFVMVDQTEPETATVYRDGQAVFTTEVSTGVPAAPTADGTYPVYLRYTSTTMSGTNPDGSHYDDPGIPWVSYFNGGDALHGFVRSSYGFPQSVGCVEIPVANAKVIWPMTPIGTLVTVFHG